MTTTSVRWTLTLERRLVDGLQQLGPAQFNVIFVVVFIVVERLQCRTRPLSRLVVQLWPTISASHGGVVLLPIPARLACPCNTHNSR